MQGIYAYRSHVDEILVQLGRPGICLADSPFAVSFFRAYCQEPRQVSLEDKLLGETAPNLLT